MDNSAKSTWTLTSPCFLGGYSFLALDSNWFSLASFVPVTGRIRDVKATSAAQDPSGPRNRPLRNHSGAHIRPLHAPSFQRKRSLHSTSTVSTLAAKNGWRPGGFPTTNQRKTIQTRIPLRPVQMSEACNFAVTDPSPSSSRTNLLRS